MTRRDMLAATAALGASGGLRLEGAIARIDPATRLMAIHTLVEMPSWAPDLGKHWDPKTFVKLCKENGVGILEMKTKNEHGHAMMPFRGRPCPRDWITETRRECSRAGIPFVAYYNVGLDEWMARQKPEWRAVNADGRPLIAFGAYHWMCVRSPWRDVVLDELRQMYQALIPDGVWFDLVGTPNSYGLGSYDPAQACCCPHCRAAYRKQYGTEQPVASGDPEIRRRLHDHGNQARIQILRDAGKLLRSLDPDVWLGSNGTGFYDRLNATPQDVRDFITFNSSEAKPHRAISFKAKSMWALGKPYQVHSYGGFTRMLPGDAVGTWAAWNLIPNSYLETSAAVVTAHGGRLSVGVNPLPDGTFAPDELANLRGCFTAVAERQQWLAHLESVPDVAVVYDWQSDVAHFPLAGTRPRLPVQQEATGLHNALLEAGMHFDVLNSESVPSRGYRALLLGDAMCASEELLATLRQHVEAGGFLLVTNETSLRDRNGNRRDNFAWSEFLGVRFKGVSPFKEANYCWVADELRGEAPAYPMLFLTEVLEVELTTARMLAELAYPAAHRTPEVFTDGETAYTHFGPRTGKPLITLNRVGKGSVMYIAAPIGREIGLREDPWLKYAIARAVRKFAPPLVLQSDVPPGVQVVLGRKRGSPAVHVISLVNLYTGLVAGPWASRAPQVGPVRLSLDTALLGTRPAGVRAIGAGEIRWSYAGDTIRIEADRIGSHAVLILA